MLVTPQLCPSSSRVDNTFITDFETGKKVGLLSVLTWCSSISLLCPDGFLAQEKQERWSTRNPWLSGTPPAPPWTSPSQAGWETRWSVGQPWAGPLWEEEGS